MTEVVELTTVEEGEVIDSINPLVPALPSAADLIPEMKAQDVAIAERYLVHFDLNRAIQDVCEYEDVEGQKGNYPPVVYNQSSRLRKDQTWLRFVAARLNESALSANRVLIELAKLASSNIEDFLNDEMLDAGMPMFDLAKAKRLGVMGCIKRVEFTEKGGVRVELYDKPRALELLAKHFNLLKEAEVKVDNYIITVVRDDD
jgi:hypothetical protein